MANWKAESRITAGMFSGYLSIYINFSYLVSPFEIQVNTFALPVCRNVYCFFIPTDTPVIAGILVNISSVPGVGEGYFLPFNIICVFTWESRNISLMKLPV